MTDRELLEAAAKAAGIVIDKSATNGGGRDNTGFDMPGNAVLDWHNGTMWNPLANDGDALRLAVKLHMDVVVDEHTAWAFNCALGQSGSSEYVGNDPYAATRRAIVRAAAAMGDKS